MSGTDDSLLRVHLYPSIPPSIRPTKTLAKSFLSSINKILSDPTSPMSNVSFYRIMKDSATPQPPVYTAHSKAINRMDARGAEVILLCALMAKYPAALSLSGQEQGLKIVKYWLKEASFVDGGGSIDVLIFILRSIKDLKVTEDGVARTGIGKALMSIKKLELATGGEGTNGLIVTNLVDEVKNQWLATSKDAKNNQNESKSASSSLNSSSSPPAHFPPSTASASTALTAADKARLRAQERAQERMKKRQAGSTTSTASTVAAVISSTSSATTPPANEPPAKRPKISFAENLTQVKQFTPPPQYSSPPSFPNPNPDPDATKNALNSMLKELFADAKYRAPNPIPGAVPANVNSACFTEWDKSTPKSSRNWVQYLNDDDIPRQPEPLGVEGVERDEMESQRSNSQPIDWGNADALKALSANPELMNGFRGPDGKYNEEGLKALCKTLGATSEASKTASNFHTAPSGQVMASNLHVSGYGQGTTTADINSLFSQYVQVNNIVWKDNFCFINTQDPFGVARARAALQGWLVNGSPLKINDAIKRGDNIPSNSLDECMQISESTPPNERDLRVMFGQHCEVVSTVIKTGFCFVNTADVAGAVLARHEMQGEAAWGGVLKVNFAKNSNTPGGGRAGYGGGGGGFRQQQQGGYGQQQHQQQQQQQQHYGGGGQPPPNFPPPPPPQMNMADLPSFVRRG
ncbi:hypothetical protein TrRE_jg8008 [Triparma retinervis]|uniref:RRM domain-containing protein n=1 Tax=Triparma retinervis TaxID=2557542 RepID=A0A9W7CHJ9_9STRA|nr:hypothetical protein TrRE_jg8008 [Triparma retinervis]